MSLSTELRDRITELVQSNSVFQIDSISSISRVHGRSRSK